MVSRVFGRIGLLSYSSSSDEFIAIVSLKGRTGFQLEHVITLKACVRVLFGVILMIREGSI